MSEQKQVRLIPLAFFPRPYLHVANPDLYTIPFDSTKPKLL